MRLRYVLLAVAAVSALAGPGCGPSKEQVQMGQALYARMDHQADYNASARFLQSHCAAHDRDYVMWAMDYASLCLMGGNYDAARVELRKAHGDINKAEDKGKETAAALSNESLKLFKGEPFERAMLCWYLGFLSYLDQDYNNARIFFAQSIQHDATTEENMKEFRDDFGLAHFWLGRAYLHADQPDNARIAFQKAAVHVKRKGEDSERSATQKAQARERDSRVRLEKKSYANATSAKPPVAGCADMSNCSAEKDLPAALSGQAGADSPVLQLAATPAEFFSVNYQKEVNLILVIETGMSPYKYLVGENGFMDAIRRGWYPEREVMVYLDAHKAGPAVPLLDLFHQADTRGTSEKDTVQAAKGVTQSVLRRMPYVGSAAALWDVRADHRFWHLMPGEVHVFAAKVKPGRYSLTLQCLDSNDNLLPRYTLTRYCVPVREGQENVYLLHTYPEADNLAPVDPGALQSARLNYGFLMMMYQYRQN